MGSEADASRDAERRGSSGMQPRAVRPRRSRPSRSPPPARTLPSSPSPNSADLPTNDQTDTPRSAVTEPKSSDKPADDEYKRVILLLRAELGKAHEELARLKDGKRQGEDSEDPTANRRSLLQEQELLKTKEALAKAQAELRFAESEGKNATQNVGDGDKSSVEISRLEAENIKLRLEKNELNEQVTMFQEKVERANEELAKETSAHARAQQSHIMLETQLNNLEEQVQKQVQQQAQAHVLQVEHVRREWETKLAENKSHYEAKLAEHGAAVEEWSRTRKQYESRLAEKEQACHE